MPPIVNKQNPKPSSNGTPQKTSLSGLLGQAKDVSELEEQSIKFTVYGQNRVGKTTLACQFPKPLLLLSFEPASSGGATSVRKIPGVKFWQIEQSSQAKQIAEELKTDSYFKSVVLDSATSYQDLFLKEILGLEKLPEQLSFGAISGDQYRERAERIKEGLRPFLSLRDKHVIITAKEKDHNPPREEKVNSRTGKVQPDMRAKFLRGMNLESYVASDLGGAAVGWLHDACDYIGRLYLAKEVTVTRNVRMLNGKEMVSETEEETGRITHRIRTMYHPNFAAGFRSPNPNAIPEYVEGSTPEALYKALITVINGGK